MLEYYEIFDVDYFFSFSFLLNFLTHNLLKVPIKFSNNDN